jgi:competence protein ComEC
MQLLPIFRKSPFARLLFFFAAGIVTAGLFNKACPSSCMLLTAFSVILLIVLFLIMHRHKSYHTGWLTGLLSALVLFIMGLLNMEIRNQSFHKICSIPEAQRICLLQIVDPPEVKEKSVKTITRLKGSMVNGKWKPDRYKVMIYFEKDSSSLRLKTGDLLWAKIRMNNVPSPGNPGEFNYSKYLVARNVYKQAYLRSYAWKFSAMEERKSWNLIAHHWQEKLLQTYHKIGLNKTLYSILAALTLGYRNDLEAHTKQIFSKAGIMHVMALSGFNVAIIALALGYMLGVMERFRSGKVLQTAIIILGIWLFAIVTGLSPSVTRASVMISFVMAGRLLQAQINTYNILFASAFVLLAFSPALLADVSFQLSFSAVLGIIIYQPVIYRFLVFKNMLADKTWKLFTVSCAAQLSTLPLTIFYFHQFPVYFWLTNLYIVPLVSVIICLAALFLLVSSLPPLALAVGKILTVLLGFLYNSVSFVEMLPNALIENIFISTHQALLLTFLILFMGLFLMHKAKIFLWASCILFLFFQLLNAAHYFETRNQQIILVGNVRGTSILSCIEGRKGILFGDVGLSVHDPKVQYALQDFWIEHGVSDFLSVVIGQEKSITGCAGFGNIYCRTPWLGNNLFLDFAGQHIVLIRDDHFYAGDAGKSLPADLVIVTGKLKPDLTSLTNKLKPDLLILDSTVSKKQAVKWKSECKYFEISCWDVSERGAYWKLLKKDPSGLKGQPDLYPDEQ